MKKITTILFGLLFTLSAFGQYPSTNIYALDMVRLGQDYFKFVNPIFVNSDNRNGYNNQPYFLDDNTLIVASQRDKKQTDIYAYDFQKSTVTRMTNTPKVSEFSPIKIPNKRAFSSICIEEDGKTQRLWSYNIGAPMTRGVLLRDISNVGYYEWVTANQLALLIVDQPNRLEITNLNNPKPVRYATNVGRCMKTLSNGDLCFVHKSENGWKFKRLDIANLDIRTIAPTLTDSEDFAVLPDNTIIMAKGDKLYKLNADRDKQWTLVADFKNFNINKITRIAVSDNKIAIVATSL